MLLSLSSASLYLLILFSLKTQPGQSQPRHSLTSNQTFFPHIYNHHVREPAGRIPRLTFRFPHAARQLECYRLHPHQVALSPRNNQIPRIPLRNQGLPLFLPPRSTQSDESISRPCLSVGEVAPGDRWEGHLTEEYTCGAKSEYLFPFFDS